MITIWKYELPLEDEFTIDMPAQSKILCVQRQGDAPVIWAIVDTERAQISRKFQIFGTGQSDIEIAEGMKYVGTFQLLGVWHLFVEESELLSAFEEAKRK